MLSIKDYVKLTENEFASVAAEGIAAGDVAGYIDSGSYVLNALLSADIYGGYSSNKITLVGSPSSTGKSYLAISAAKNFLHQNPNGIVFYFESESAITKDMLVSRGVDVSRTVIIPVVTVQDFKKQAVRILDNYEKEPVDERQPLFFVLDSMGMLSTNKEIEDSSSGSDTKDMTRAGQLKAAFRVLTLRMGRSNCPLFVTNHVYADMGGGPYASAIQGGGTGALYSSSTILTLTKAKEKDNSGDVVGAIVSVTATKSRLTRENTKVKCLIRYDGGMDRYYGLLTLAEEAGIFKKVGTRYELEDGRKIYGKTINENPEEYYTKDVLDRINEYVKKTFAYGATQERTLIEGENND